MLQVVPAIDNACVNQRGCAAPGHVAQILAVTAASLRGVLPNRTSCSNRQSGLLGAAKSGVGSERKVSDHKTMGRQVRIPEELRAASEHLHYEVSMFDAVARTLMAGIFGDGVATNAFLESFTIHGRALVQFFFATSPKCPRFLVSAHTQERRCDRRGFFPRARCVAIIAGNVAGGPQPRQRPGRQGDCASHLCPAQRHSRGKGLEYRGGLAVAKRSRCDVCEERRSRESGPIMAAAYTPK